eukprot:jgi/Bigna1/44181/e_gw1.90.48.1
MNGKDFIDSTFKFKYYDPIEIFNSTPAYGPITGGTRVTLSGANFENNDKLFCKFGSINVTAEFVKSTEVICVSPAQSEAVIQVSVTNNYQDFSLSTTPFEYL